MMVNDIFSSSVRSLVLGHHHCTRTRLGGTQQWLKALGALPSAMATRCGAPSRRMAADPKSSAQIRAASASVDS